MSTKRTPKRLKKGYLDVESEHLLADLIASIEEFDTKCNDAQHTDTGEAWDLLNGIKVSLASILARVDAS
jgi:hypothetical protein